MSRAVLLLVALGLVGVSCIPASAKSKGTEMLQPFAEYRVDARQFSYEPDEIRVRAGARVRLIVTSVDVDHRLSLTGIKLDRESVEGRQQTVEFVAWPAGTYPFECAVSCGMTHSQMGGTLVVE